MWEDSQQYPKAILEIKTTLKAITLFRCIAVIAVVFMARI